MPSDIEIAQSTPMLPITQIAHQLGLPEQALVAYGPHKAKIALPHLRALEDRPNGRLVLVTGINPTPAGEGKTTTTVAWATRSTASASAPSCVCASPRWARSSGSRAALPAAGGPRWCRWKTSTCTSRATFRPSRWRTTCWRR
jgi:hypothetical protein